MYVQVSQCYYDEKGINIGTEIIATSMWKYIPVNNVQQWVNPFTITV